MSIEPLIAGVTLHGDSAVAQSERVLVSAVDPEHRSLHRRR